MFDNIPPTRLLIYVMSAGLIPLLIVLALFMSAQTELSELQDHIQQVKQLALIREKKQSVNMALRHHYRDADHFYIDKHLETLTFLENEIESLQKITTNKNYPEDESVKKRLEHLSGAGNNMIFSEGVVQAFPLFQETTETLVHTVEVNTTDLQQILSRIDGVEIGSFVPPPNRPQLIVLDFKLDRKTVNEKNEVFLLNLKLLKREFL